MFWDNFVLLCNKNGVSPNGVCKMLNLSTAIATKWKNGSVPRDTTLKRLADYFGVSVEYMLGKENFASEHGALDENTVMYRYNEKEYKKHLTREQMEAVHLVIDALPESK